MPVAGEIALMLALVVIGGCFAAAEIALVSLRPGQVTRMVATRRSGVTVQRLLTEPNRFLSAVQLGVTLTGFLSSAVGAVVFSDPLADWLQRTGLSEGAARTLALPTVTMLVAYLSLVVGELAPKRIGLQRAEAISLLAAGPLEMVARISTPVIWLLGASSGLLVRMAGVDPRQSREEMTEEELRDIVAGSVDLTLDARQLIAEVLDAGDRPIREVMVPRLDVSALSADLPVAEAIAAVQNLPHSRYPVVDGGLDDVVGFVHVRDLFREIDPPVSVTLRRRARPVMRLPDSRRALPALAEMRRAGSHLAVVVDEYGGAAGIVTLEDLLEELVGDITDEFDPQTPQDGRQGVDAQGRDEGSRMPTAPVYAQLRLDEFEEATGIRFPDGPYNTAAGWVLHELGRIPQVGDHAVFEDVLVTVDTMRGRRVERVLLQPSPPGGLTGPEY
ncbi:MAG: magnesium and cobalt exporter, family [Actinomycetota bacterium]|nr:magnesium and cobalt exporter, family [Actinomycetota bacterium]